MAEEKKTRAKQVRKPAIFIIEVLNENGEPIPGITKNRINVVAATTNSDAALDLMEGSEHPHAVYVRAPIVS